MEPNIVRIRVFKSFCNDTLIELDLSGSGSDIRYFSYCMSDGVKNCAINKCRRVTTIGAYAWFEYNGRTLPILPKMTDTEVSKQLDTVNPPIVWVQESSTCVNMVYCHICLKSTFCDNLHLAKNNNVVCKGCASTYHIPTTKPFKLSRDLNIVFLDSQIGWFNHDSYQDRTEKLQC